MQWDLIAAGVEEGIIEFFKLEGKESTNMKGRSNITFTHKKQKAPGKASKKRTAMPVWSPEQAG